jgi:DNA polymerase III sliding clamp (beta) subunit (PCNA family)
MKRVRIDSWSFNEIMKTMQGAVATDKSRPALTKCKCEVDEQAIKFTTLDGYVATVFTLEHKCVDVEPFSFLFNLFKVESTKQGLDEVTIEQDGDYISFKWFDKELNQVEKRIKREIAGFVDIDKVYQDNRSDDRITIGFNARILTKILKSIAKGNGLVTITFDRSDSKKPIFIKPFKSDFGDAESLVLPIRLDF